MIRCSLVISELRYLHVIAFILVLLISTRHNDTGGTNFRFTRDPFGEMFVKTCILDIDPTRSCRPASSMYKDLYNERESSDLE